MKLRKRLEGSSRYNRRKQQGIGLATAQRFVDEGAYVFITGRRQSELDAAVTEIGDNAIGVQGDVSNLADLIVVCQGEGAEGPHRHPVRQRRHCGIRSIGGNY